jgi:hypothetical protein
MNMRYPTMLVTALLAGLAGGLAPRLLTVPKPSGNRYGTIRATRIELVDESGRVRAFIGTDKGRDTALVFVDDQKRERAVFGLWYGSSIPTLVMRGGDGEDRVTFRLSPRVDERPVILLRDHERTRVHLGFYENDAPGPQDEEWAIRFCAPYGFEGTLAAVGVQRDPHRDEAYGYVGIRKDSQTWHELK